jgi:hypothetical protein
MPARDRDVLPEGHAVEVAVEDQDARSERVPEAVAASAPLWTPPWPEAYTAAMSAFAGGAVNAITPSARSVRVSSAWLLLAADMEQLRTRKRGDSWRFCAAGRVSAEVTG